jgi:hypothetical protein
MSRSLVLMGIALSMVATACSGVAAPSATTAAPPTSPSTAPTAAPSVASAPTTAPSASPAHPLVGEWLGEHRCEHIVEALTAAGLEETILDNIVGNGLLPGVASVDQIADPGDPCADAIVVPHSHEFTADGRFASYDGSHQQVDSGAFTIVDEDTFAIDRTFFTYVVEGDELTFEADAPTQWSTMVALPGLVWERVGD